MEDAVFSINTAETLSEKYLENLLWGEKVFLQGIDEDTYAQVYIIIPFFHFAKKFYNKMNEWMMQAIFFKNCPQL